VSRPKAIAVYDANVLFPAPLRDLLVRLAIEKVVRAHWTDVIHEEWISSVLKRRSDLTRKKLTRTRELMDGSVPAALVHGYERHIPALHLPDPGDAHVLAAAIEAGAQVIVTFNLSDFPASELGSYGIVAQHPGDFVLSLFAANRAGVCKAAAEQRANLKNPPVSVEHYLATIAGVGLQRTSERLRDCIL